MKTLIKKNNGGFALIASILIFVFLGLFMILSFTQASSNVRYARTSRNAEEAFYAAEAGLQDALSELRGSLSWTGTGADPNTGDDLYEAVQDNDNNVYGFYHVDVGAIVNNQNSAWQMIPLTITGRSAPRSASENTATRILDVVVRAQSPTAFFISSLNDLEIGSGADIQSSVLARDVDIGVATQSAPITVDGKVLYIRNVSGYDQANPYLDIAGGVEQSMPITFTGVDKDKFRVMAQNGGEYHSGDLVLDTTTLNDSYKQNNNITGEAIIYAEGDVHLSGVIVDGGFAIVAGGDIYIDGDVTYDDIAVTSNQVGLFAKGDIIFNPVNANRTSPDLTVHAFLMAEGEAKRMNNYTGNGTLTFHGAMAIKGGDGTSASAIDLQPAFSLRDYSYHEELFKDPVDGSDTCTIPGMSYIADVHTWEIRGDPADVI